MVRDMFMREPVSIQEGPCTKFACTYGLFHVSPMQPVLRSLNGAISRMCSVIGRVQPPAYANILFEYLSSVGKRY